MQKVLLLDHRPLHEPSFQRDGIGSSEIFAVLHLTLRSCVSVAFPLHAYREFSVILMSDLRIDSFDHRRSLFSYL